MKWKPRRDRIFVLAAFALVWLAGSATPAVAQDRTKSPLTTRPRLAAEKWRPKEGVYASPGRDFVADCGEGSAYFDIDIAKRWIGGNEWSCDITKVTDTAPAAIKLNMTCDNYNLAEMIKAPENKRFKEIFLFKKIDDNTMFVRRTLNGKFTGTWWRAAYCPDEQQRMHAGIEPEPWLPKDGIYASPGADFEDRCLKSADTVIDLANKSISNGGDRCEIFSREDALPGDTIMSVVCNEKHDTKGTVVVRYIDGWPRVGPPGFEVVRLEKIDDKTISLRKTRDGKSSEPARQLSYCSNEAQRAHLETKARDKGAAEQKATGEPVPQKQ